MKENIETKDVQRTEYLDKNGLDMLWTKVKENTHNQVEVEYNRAKAKEDSLSQEIASVKPAEGKEFLQVEEIYNTKTLKDGPLAFGNIGNQAGVTKYAVAQQEGFLVYSAKDEPFDFKTVNISSTGIQSEDERKSDTKVWNTNGGITDLTSYALNSDVTEKIAAKADTTALEVLEAKVVANTTAINNIGKSNGIPYDTSITNYYQTDKPFYIKCDNDHTAYINPYSGIKVANSDTSYVNITPSLMRFSNGDASCELNQYLGMQYLLGTSDDSYGFKLSPYGLRIGKKSDINANNNELISISRQSEAGSSIFKVEGNRIEGDVYLLDEEGLTNDKRYNTNTETLYLRHAALHGAILVGNNADLSIGYDNNIRTRPFWKFGFYGAEFNGSDGQKRIDINTGNSEYANIFGIKISNNVFNQNSHINDPCEIQNDRDYVSFSKKIKVSDIITDTTTDSSLNSVLSKKVDVNTYNSFTSYVGGQISGLNSGLSALGGQIASKQDKITPTTELDLTSIDTADIESLRSIVKSLATELNALGLIKLKSAEETA